MSLLIWNMGGLNVTNYILNKKAQGFTPPLYNLVPEFMCLQESCDNAWGDHSGKLVAAGWNPFAGGIGGYTPISNLVLNNASVYNGYVIHWQANHCQERCNLAIFWLALLGTHASMPIDGWHDMNPNHRPVFWVTPANGGRRTGCIHAPVYGNMLYINEAIEAISKDAPASGWTLAGDFGLNPDKLILPEGTSTIYTNEPGASRDYVIYGGEAPFVKCASAAGPVGNSDHPQIRFY